MTAMQKTSPPSTIDMLGENLHTDMVQVNSIIIERMESHVPMIPELAGYLIAAGGKRIRPLLTLACAAIYGDKSDHPKKLAAAVEFIHTATLLHDDVVDGSDQRRGRDSANAVFGNQASILVGDFLFARAFELMVETGSLNALNCLAKTSAIITEGEVLQMSLIGDTSITREQYFKVIEAKTAALFSAACEVVPLLNNQDSQALADYGYHLGMAFQITDDVMDYTSPKMGKDKGDDFLEGKITLPVIIALEEADEADKQALTSYLITHQKIDLDDMIALLGRYDAFQKSSKIAENYALKAKQSLEKIGVSHQILELLKELPETMLGRMA
jgi:octaprenyl-diphosphate synthase